MIIDIQFPFGGGGYPIPATDIRAISDLIEQLLNIGLGEILWDSNYGVNIWQYVFANIDSNLVKLLQAEVYESIKKFLPMVTISNIGVAVKNSTVTISVVFIYNNEKGRIDTDYPIPTR